MLRRRKRRKKEEKEEVISTVFYEDLEQFFLVAESFVAEMIAAGLSDLSRFWREGDGRSTSWRRRTGADYFFFAALLAPLLAAGLAASLGDGFGGGKTMGRSWWSTAAPPSRSSTQSA
jgi:hypothetical protein